MARSETVAHLPDCSRFLPSSLLKTGCLTHSLRQHNLWVRAHLTPTTINLIDLPAIVGLGAQNDPISAQALLDELIDSRLLHATVNETTLTFLPSPSTRLLPIKPKTSRLTLQILPPDLDLLPLLRQDPDFSAEESEITKTSYSDDHYRLSTETTSMSVLSDLKPDIKPDLTDTHPRCLIDLCSDSDGEGAHQAGPSASVRAPSSTAFAPLAPASRSSSLSADERSGPSHPPSPSLLLFSAAAVSSRTSVKRPRRSSDPASDSQTPKVQVVEVTSFEDALRSQYALFQRWRNEFGQKAHGGSKSVLPLLFSARGSSHFSRDFGC